MTDLKTDITLDILKQCFEYDFPIKDCILCASEKHPSVVSSLPKLRESKKYHKMARKSALFSIAEFIADSDATYCFESSIESTRKIVMDLLLSIYCCKMDLYRFRAEDC